MRLVLVYFIGLIFSLGIVISGMVNPAKVQNFFDVMGFWDPSLAFVMGGALAHNICRISHRAAASSPHNGDIF